jgi:ABC-2 type transport system ATP-binding protein
VVEGAMTMPQRFGPVEETRIRPSATTSTAQFESPAVHIGHLTKRYGATVAVDDLSFSIRRGTIAGFLGPNGAGKTTTFRMLVGLAAPTSGAAQVLGQAYGTLRNPILRVGAMLEVSGYHPARSARNHLLVLARTADIPEGRVDELLGLVELDQAADRAVGGFSSGMRQRLGLAASLLGDPELLLLDEPANGLDPKGIRWLRQFLRNLAHEQGKTVLVSSHVLAEVAQMVDEVVIINRGRLITQGPVDTVVAHMGRTVAIRSPDATRLADLLTRQGATVTRHDADRLLVSGVDIEEVGRLAAVNNLVLYELREQGLSLEETFLALTEPAATP